MPLTSFPAASRRRVAESLPQRLAMLRGETELAAVWIPDTEPWFEVLAEIESSSFPEVEGLFDDPSARFEFLTILGGPEPGVHQVLHTMRVAFPTETDPCFLLRDLARSGQVSDDELQAEFAARGFQARNFISVESSARVQPLSLAGSAALPAYCAVLDRVLSDGLDGVVAHQNRAARRSFDRIGLTTQPLLVDRTVHTPDGHGGVDTRYEPRLIPLTPAVQRVLSLKHGRATPVFYRDGGWVRQAS